MSVDELVTELRQMGKLKGGGASGRGDYGTVYRTLARAPDRFLKQPGRGEFSVVPSAPPLPDARSLSSAQE
jgi:hypothetical protein